MPTNREFAGFVFNKLSEIEGIRLSKMMGEYLLYCHGKIVGGLYDNSLLVKITPSAQRLLPNASPLPPYPGAKTLLPVADLDDFEFLRGLILSVVDEIPPPAPKKLGKRKA